jgi:predicted phosphodiesterase
VRFLIVSDIHANRFGLEAVLLDAEGRYDGVLCMGDVVGYGAHPNICCEILREAGADCLLGNHDAAALGLISSEWFNEVAAFAIEWTSTQLTPENRRWLKNLPPQKIWSEYSFQGVHGSLREPLEEYIFTRAEAQPTLARLEYSLCFFGHTHSAIVYEELDAPRKKYTLEATPLPHGGTVKLDAKKKYLINPGSCGQPRDGNPQARYALFDTDSQNVEVCACDYDIEAARAAILEAGLPTFLGDRLLRGR